jgi:hypothetical protein
VLGGLDEGQLRQDPTFDERSMGSSHRLNLTKPEAGSSTLAVAEMVTVPQAEPLPAWLGSASARLGLVVP